MRVLVLVLTVLALGGCNLVYSEKPLFTKADARGAPPLRPGVWVKPKPDCEFTADQRPLPDCADPLVIEAQVLRPPPDAAKAAGGPNQLPYVLARGEPRVMQVEVDLKAGERMWLYQGLRAVRTDGQGRIVEARLWPVLCGPPPAKGATGADGETAYVTPNPLPGLEVRAESCLARAPGPVRNAAAASEAWDEDQAQIRWLREAD
jgi:hypothetical protein